MSLTDLQQELAGLEREVAVMKRELAREVAAVADWEQRAMAAVRLGNEAAARDALKNNQRHMDAAAARRAELVHVESLAQACREVIAELREEEDPGNPPAGAA